MINDDDAFVVLRQKGTEPPGSSELNQLSPDTEEGILTCKACGAPLFSVSTKFDSGTGWPSFYAPVTQEAIDYSVDFDAIFPRTECVCSQCGSHLGHVFEDGPFPTSLRYCMNGISMEYSDKSQQQEDNGNANDSIMIQQQDPVEASRLPFSVVLPAFLANMAVALLMFLSYWTKHDLPTTQLGKVLVDVPLPFAAFFAYTAAKSLTRFI